MGLTEFIIDITSNINALIRKISSKHKLTHSQTFHLFNIPYDGISMSKLANKLSLDNSTLTRNIQKLEKMNLIQRSKDQLDGRINKIQLTASAIKIMQSIESSLELQNQKIIKNLDINSQEKLISSLEKLSWALSFQRGEY